MGKIKENFQKEGNTPGQMLQVTASQALWCGKSSMADLTHCPCPTLFSYLCFGNEPYLTSSLSKANVKGFFLNPHKISMAFCQYSAQPGAPLWCSWDASPVKRG